LAKITQQYETIFIVNPTLNEDEINASVAKFKELIESSATIDQFDVWGKRRLAYPIQDLNEGHYVLVRFTSPPDFPKELDRVYNITDSIMRSIIVTVEENRYTRLAKEKEAQRAAEAAARALARETEREAQEQAADVDDTADTSDTTVADAVASVVDTTDAFDSDDANDASGASDADDAGESLPPEDNGDATDLEQDGE